MSRYNGYTNYQTWCVCLHIDNDEYAQAYWRQRAIEYAHKYTDESEAMLQLAEDIQTELDEHTGLSPLHSDLLNNALAFVEWREVAESRLDDEEWRDAIAGDLRR